jgi:hypothetical protein
VATRDMHLASGRRVVALPRVPVVTAVSVAGAQAAWDVTVDVSVSTPSRRSRVRLCDDHSPWQWLGQLIDKRKSMIVMTAALECFRRVLTCHKLGCRRCVSLGAVDRFLTLPPSFARRDKAVVEMI